MSFQCNINVKAITSRERQNQGSKTVICLKGALFDTK